MPSQLPGLALWSCYNGEECGDIEEYNFNINTIAAELYNCVTATDASTITNDASGFTSPQPGDAYVDTAGCLCVYLGPTKGWVCNPPVCGRQVWDPVNNCLAIWDDGVWKTILKCDTILSNTIDKGVTSSFPSGTLGFNDSVTPYTQFVTVNGVWVPTGITFDPATNQLVSGPSTIVCAADDAEAEAEFTALCIDKQDGIFYYNTTELELRICKDGVWFNPEAAPCVDTFTDATQAGIAVKLNAEGKLDPNFICQYPCYDDVAAFEAAYPGSPLAGQRFYDKTTGCVMVYDGVLTKWRDESELKSPPECFVIENSSGFFVTGPDDTWTTMPLPDTLTPASFITPLGGDQFTLSGGCCYDFSAAAMFYRLGFMRIRVWDVTNQVELPLTQGPYGLSTAETTSGTGSTGTSLACGKVCIPNDITIELQYLHTTDPVAFSAIRPGTFLKINKLGDI